MRQLFMRYGLLFIAIAITALPQTSTAVETNDPVRQQRIDASDTSTVRILFQRRKSSGAQDGDALAQELREQSGVSLHYRRGTRGEVEVLQSETAATSADMQRALRKLQARTDIEYAAIDQRRHAHAVPSDALYPTQWYLQDVQASAIAANAAWDITTGGAGTVVAVLDTGVRFDHPDLQRAAQAGKLLPGYDFVSGESSNSFLTANDGDGWDADPSDPGDWVDGVDQQKAIFSKCTIENSSWHGTRVAGLIGAASNNGIGIAGTSWGVFILPVRVLGKCGGYDSDILPAMRWAAGLHVSGVPDNPYPAKILNLSFGSPATSTSCTAYQSVIQELAALGVLVVVSAGNEGGPVDSPANCPLALGVAGLRHSGTKVGYSSLGSEIAISAPAGNCVNLSGACLFSLHTTYDIGTTVPAGSDYTNQFNTNLGTSFSAPIAAGAAALMHAVNARLDAAQLRARMIEGARAFPSTAGVPTCHVPVDQTDKQTSECNCTTSTCGGGMVNAPGAVIAAQRPIASVSVPTIFNPGSTVSLDASASGAACGRTIGAYQWSVVSATGTSPPVLAPNNLAMLQVTAPLLGSYTLRLTVTDSQGATDTADVLITPSASTNNASTIPGGVACPATINVTPAQIPTSTPAATPSSSGGGAIEWYWLWMLVGIASRRVARTSSTLTACN